MESTLQENVKNLDNKLRLGKYPERSVNELWKRLEKDENLYKWQLVVPPQSYATVLQQNKSREERNQVEENKNNDGRNQEDQSFKLVIFRNSITKFIVPHQLIKCKEHKDINFSQSAGNLKDIYL